MSAPPPLKDASVPHPVAAPTQPFPSQPTPTMASSSFPQKKTMLCCTTCTNNVPPHSLLPLLRQLSTAPLTVDAPAITTAVTAISMAYCSPIQTGALLTALHYTGLDQRADIIAAAATAMRGAGVKIGGLEDVGNALDGAQTNGAVDSGSNGVYQGGLVDIVGTGGDGHDTYNVSTTAAVVASGCGVKMCKHGSRASTSSSGSADILAALGAKLTAVTSPVISSIFADTTDTNPDSLGGRFAFIFAQVFHPAMSHIAPIRRDLGCRTIFNVLGPLISPVDYSVSGGLEARVLGVGSHHLGPVYADTLRTLGVRRALVVCGEEELDEVSPEGFTRCWRLHEQREVEEFRIHPTMTFGLECHPLTRVAGGKGPEENAGIFRRLLHGEVKDGDPVKDFVLINAATLLVVAGVAQGKEKVVETVDGIRVMGGERWKDAVRRAREGMDGGEAWREWERFVEISRKAEEEQRKQTEI